jgi:hypothetical protein
VSDVAAAPQLDYVAAATAEFRGERASDLTPLGVRLIGEFGQAVLDRQPTEERWLTDLRQYKGKYEPDELAEMKSRSSSFVRKTRTKVKTVDARVSDLLFPTGKERSWSVSNTPEPSLSDEQKQEIVNMLAKAGNMQPAPDDVKKMAIDICKAAAERMSVVIDDQLVEARYKKSCVATIHSGNLYGTGVLKGPLVEKKVRERWKRENKKWVTFSESYIVPFVENVPLWRFYPDMAANELDGCQYVWERHTFTPSRLSDLATRKTFDGKKIRNYILAHPKGETTKVRFDMELKSLGERINRQADPAGNYEVLERWGYVSAADLKDVGVEVPPERAHETFFANIWMFPSGDVIKAVLQPISGVTWPYHMYYFDKDETSIFGDGLSSVMRDDQKMLNAATRLMIDNAAITSGPMVEVITSYLSSLENVSEMSAWKVWLRNSTDPGNPAVRPIELPNNLEWLESMARMFDNNSDETTAIPKYMSGENPTAGAAGTATGMSMLMGAANIVIKDLITNWDEGITTPFLQALYRWNMQFHSDESIKGDFDAKATGTSSLVAKEIRAQALAQFAAQTNNPVDGPLIKRPNLLRQIAQGHELTDVVKTDKELQAEQESEQAKSQASLQQRMQEAQTAHLEGQAKKVLAEAEVAAVKVKEMLANIELLIAKAVDVKVETIYAALQAGGTATVNPRTAPAGDEILKSAGFVDSTPQPSIASLDNIPVQATDGTQNLLNKGQTFAQSPDQPGAPQGAPVNTDPTTPAPADQAQPMGAAQPQSGQPPTGQEGERAGIETARIEQ